MTTLELVLGVAVVMIGAALGVVASLLYRERADRSDEIGTDQLSTAMGKTLNDLDVRETIGRVEQHAAEMAETHESLETMLRHPGDRGGFGELQLETILSDHLPSDMFGTQERVVDGLQPDAYIESTEGVICIDSKFPLDNYRRYVDADDEAPRESAQVAFRNNVKEHLATVANKYVRPAQGTTRFAFVFVPSESVYHYLITHEQDLLREYTAEGVQMVSPLTVGQKLELIRTGIHAQQMSEKAEEVQEQLETLAERFDGVMNAWDTFYGHHFENAVNRASDVDGKLSGLHREFETLSEFETET